MKWKWKEIKQQPSMLPGPSVPGSCLVFFHFLWAILSTSTVHICVVIFLTLMGQTTFSEPLNSHIKLISQTFAHLKRAQGSRLMDAHQERISRVFSLPLLQPRDAQPVHAASSLLFRACHVVASRVLCGCFEEIRYANTDQSLKTEKNQHCERDRGTRARPGWEITHDL